MLDLELWMLLLVVVVVFIVTREFWTWYFKFNSLVRIEELLKQVLERLPGPPKPETEPPKEKPKGFRQKVDEYER